MPARSPLTLPANFYRIQLSNGFEFESKSFWDEPQVEAELKRVFDICNGCRRCYNLCPSFNDLFVRLDNEAVDGDAEKLKAEDLGSVTDLCYQCKLCFNHCPYTPSTERLTRIEFPENLRSVFLSRPDIAVEKEERSLYVRALAPDVEDPLSLPARAGPRTRISLSPSDSPSESRMGSSALRYLPSC